MAFDAATRTMVLFGGISDGGYLDDTWSWNGATWTRLFPSTSPPPRSGASMAYDAATRTVLLFGGFGWISGAAGAYSAGFGWLNDTWSWNGTTWTRLSPGRNPGGSDTDSMAYDPATKTVLLFNGGLCNSCAGQGQTWNWNGRTWTRLSLPTGPPTTSWSSMAYDPATMTVLLWLQSGATPIGQRDQTWSWNGTTWTRLSPRASPPVGSLEPPSGGWSMAYDPATATVLLFGGTTDKAPVVMPLDETWSWDGTTWTHLSLASSPPPSGGASMAYDPGMEAMLLVEQGYGNHIGQPSDTWTLTDASPPSVH